MNKIGIMQGRIFPERLDKFQIFPVSNWKDELIKIEEIGFNCVELLFDKKLVLEKLLADFEKFKSLGIKPNNKKNGFIANSICVDYFSSIFILNPEMEPFYDKIIKIIDTINNTTIDVLAISLLDVNFFISKNDFQLVLN